MTAQLASRVPQTISNFVKLVSELADIAGSVAVAYGMPRTWERDVLVVTGDAPEISQDFAAQGNRPRDEAFKISVVVNVYDPGYSAQDAVERAFAIAGAVELGVCRNNPTLQLSPSVQGPVLWNRFTPTKCSVFQTDEGFGANLDCTLDCIARI